MVFDGVNLILHWQFIISDVSETFDDSIFLYHSLM